jgi:hypothetical protein
VQAVPEWEAAMGWNNLLPAVLAGSVSSCVTPPARFVSNVAASQDKFMQDRYACLKETQQPTSATFVGGGDGGSSRSVVEPSCGVFNACLAARGYSQSETGPLTVPSEAVIRCHR